MSQDESRVSYLEGLLRLVTRKDLIHESYCAIFRWRLYGKTLDRWNRPACTCVFREFDGEVSK